MKLYGKPRTNWNMFVDIVCSAGSLHLSVLAVDYYYASLSHEQHPGQIQHTCNGGM